MLSASTRSLQDLHSATNALCGTTLKCCRTHLLCPDTRFHLSPPLPVLHSPTTAFTKNKLVGAWQTPALTSLLLQLYFDSTQQLEFQFSPGKTLCLRQQRPGAQGQARECHQPCSEHHLAHRRSCRDACSSGHQRVWPDTAWLQGP